MNKEEILEKSRKENKNKDVYENEILKQGQAAGCIVMAVLALIFLVAQVVAGGGIDYGIYAIMFSAQMARYWVRWFKLKTHSELAMALLYTVFVLALSAAHFYNLFAAGTIK